MASETDGGWCPVAATARLVGRKWHLVVVHRLLTRGALGFNDLDRAIDGISSKVLSSTLDDLSEKGFVERRVVSEKPFRVEYDLTRRGESLRPVVAAVRAWGSEHLDPSGAHG
ncbi:MAG: winged helix-turn-helix transcriptional regulator [Haloarculaceae archaeon]